MSLEIQFLLSSRLEESYCWDVDPGREDRASRSVAVGEGHRAYVQGLDSRVEI